MSKAFHIRMLIGLAAVGATVSLSGCGAALQETLDAAEDAQASAEAELDDPMAGEAETDVFDIAVGDCLNDGAATGEVTEVPTIGCDQPHDSEVYHEFESTAAAFDQTAIDTEAEEGCQAAFEPFVGFPYETSVLYFSWYAPTQESWDSGDREIDCLIYEEGVQTTGTLAGAAR
ncbi:septum formation family protein [Nocardiopsis sediminis]|uniref:Septum formation family protein n=1 Tax=Nocardiopsis sediminis TaxID=1778267 RepID=A0ABV8FQT5_9ACTN